ncbi:MAG TPA: SDR family NAD(P)-dependent oxidoreductase [Caulobacteraceae bacterium]|nr:SDR family NAD(P)-dependent oxidoreductase [Caulobacteraceae bacterium]
MPTALVTGANRGIGKETARQLAQRGYFVWLGARSEAQGRAAEAEMRGEGLDVAWLALDVADEASVAAAAARVAGETPALDALVNNAAISRERADGGSRPYAPSQMPMAKLRETFDVNFFGAVAVTQALMPRLRAAPAARIVNVSSGLGSFAFNTDGSDSLNQSLNILGYKTSKAALNMATVLFARELADTPIKVNAASPSAPTPGPVATDLSGPGRAEVLRRQGFGTPAQGAETVVYLATLPADGPTGAFYDVNVEGRILPW